MWLIRDTVDKGLSLMAAVSTAALLHSIDLLFTVFFVIVFSRVILDPSVAFIVSSYNTEASSSDMCFSCLMVSLQCG